MKGMISKLRLRNWNQQESDSDSSLTPVQSYHFDYGLVSKGVV